MIQLEYYFGDIRAGVYKIEPDEEVRTIGSGNCHFNLRSDKTLLSVHCMLRYQQGYFEICPVGPMAFHERALSLNHWSQCPFNERLYLSEKSYLVLVGGQNPENLTMYFEDASDGASIFPSSQETTTEASKPASLLDLGPGQGEFIEQAEISSAEEKEIEEIIQRAEARKKQKIAPSLTAEMQEIEGTLVASRYQVIRRLGSGGMGDVYEALDNQLRRKVALKILKHADINSVAGKRFMREAQALVKVHHAHIVQVHDIGKWNDRPFFTMDLISGPTLQELVAEGPIAPRKAMQWIMQIANALEAVHGHGIIHRDIKPSNIMIEGKKAVLTDFGIAKDTAELTQLTTTGETLGTPAYMSPEQAVGNPKEISPRSDVYSLGAVLYELLSAKPPFSGHPVQIMHQVATRDPIPLSKLNPDIHPDAVTICQKAMTKEPQYRYANAAEMAKDIQHYLDGEPIQGELAPIWIRWKRTLRQNKKLAVVVSTLLGILVFVWIWNLYQNFSLMQQRKQQIETYLAEAEQARKDLSAQKPLTDMIHLLELYSQATLLGAQQKEILTGKFDVLLTMSDYAIERGNWNFAQALCYYAEQLQNQLQSPEYQARVQFARSKLSTRQKAKIEEDMALVQEAFDTLATTESPELAKELAFVLLRVPELLPALLTKYQNHPNPQIKAAFRIAQACQQKPPADWTPIEQQMITLLPYSNQPFLQYTLIQNLESEYVSIRAFCCRMLGFINAQETLPLLTKRVEFEHEPEILRYALSSMLMIKQGEAHLFQQMQANKIDIDKLQYAGKRAIPILLKLLPTSDEASQEKITQVFRTIGESAIPMLLNGLKSSPFQDQLKIVAILDHWASDAICQYYVQNFAIAPEPLKIAYLKSFAKHYVNHPNAQELLLTSLNHPNLCAVVIPGLAQIPKPEILEKVVEYLGSPQPEIQTIVRDALASAPLEIQPILAAQYPKASPPIQRAILQILAQQKSETAIDPLIQYIIQPPASSENIRLALEYLPFIGTKALEPLYQAYWSVKDMSTQLNVLKVIRKIPTDQSKAGFYEKAFAKAQPQIAEYIVESLGDVGIQAWPMLRKIVIHGKGRILQNAAQACAQIGQSLVKPLVELLQKGDPSSKVALEIVQANVAFTLEKMGSPALDTIIALALKTDDAGIKAAIIPILSKSKESKIIGPLLKLLDDSASFVQEAAEKALIQAGSIATSEILNALDQSKVLDYQIKLLGILGKIKDIAALPKLYELLGHKQLYNKTAKVLKEYGSGIVPQVVPLMQDPKKEQGIRLFLQQLGAKAAVEALQNYLATTTDPAEIRLYVPQLLIPFQDKVVIEYLFKIAFTDPQEPVKQAAWKAIETLGEASLEVIVLHYYQNDQRSACTL